MSTSTISQPCIVNKATTTTVLSPVHPKTSDSQRTSEDQPQVTVEHNIQQQSQHNQQLDLHHVQLQELARQ